MEVNPNRKLQALSAAAARLEPCSKVVGMTVAIFPQAMTETARVEKHLAETYRLTLRHQVTIPEATSEVLASSAGRQHFLYFCPLPQGQGSLRRRLQCYRATAAGLAQLQGGPERQASEGGGI